FVALSTGLIVQIAILMLNSLLMLPDLVSFSPADFLHEMAPNTNISLPVTGSIFTIIPALPNMLGPKNAVSQFITGNAALFD
ncbi:hypothetical protein ACI3PM_18000, partial [Lactiplantibacillus plantarum]